jgi:hypothetical protein
MGPIDYTMQVQQPFESALQGFKAGSGIRQVMDERAQAESAAAQQAQLQADLAAASQDPKQLPGLMVRYPQLAKELKHGWDVMNGEQQQASLSHASEVFAALQSGRPDVARSVLTTRATALRNSGDEEGAKRAEDMAQWAEQHPDSLKTSIGLRLAALPGGDKVIEGVVKLGGEQRAAELQPGAVRKVNADASAAESDATTKGVTAKYAESNALKDLETKGWNIQALQADIDFKKQSARIAAMNASLAKEGNELKRKELEMKLDEAVSARESKLREKVQTAEAGASAIDNMLNTVERIKKNGRLNDVVGGIEGRLPAVRDESVDAVALIETLGSQAFLAQIPNIKGMGALSNAEGEKLQAAFQNLSRTQSEKQFRANLDEAARLLKKGREALARGTGVPLGKPDTPAAPGSRPPLSSFEVSQSAQGGQRSQ